MLTEMSNNRYPKELSVIECILFGSADLPEQCYLKRHEKNASNNAVDIITENLLFYTTPCFEAFTVIGVYRSEALEILFILVYF